MSRRLGGCIMLVDDSRDEAAFVRTALAASHPAVTLVVCRSGRDALTQLEHAAADGMPVDFVLLDLKLPGFDGHATLAAIRSRHAAGALPVVVFTSSREASDVVRAYAAGANSYVVKPLVFEEYARSVVAAAQYWLDVNVTQS